MRWQYISSKVMYPLVVAPIYFVLSLRYLITPFHLIHTNPSLPYGGMQIASKTEIMQRFEKSPLFLKQLFVSKDDSLVNKLKNIMSFMKQNKLKYPVIAKPDKSCVGFGVCKITSDAQLKAVFEKINVDYIVQEYTPYKNEYGVFFVKIPGEKTGSVLSLTKKEIPTVIGDGVSTTKELVLADDRFVYNRESLLSRAQGLDYVAKKDEVVTVINQGSHTYGAIFTDASDLITSEMNNWVNRLCALDKEFYFGRFDLLVKDDLSLDSGKNVHVVELNGCMSEPIHMYDDSYSFWYGIQCFFKFNSLSFKIAKMNIKQKNLSSPQFRKMIQMYRDFFKTKDSLMEQGW